MTSRLNEHNCVIFFWLVANSVKGLELLPGFASAQTIQSFLLDKRLWIE
jgi:hypothetical protein